MEKLFLVSGPSGSGKTTLMKEAGKNKIVTMTTRPKREGEIEGIDYFFVPKEDFERWLSEDQVIEHNLYPNGHYYGLTKQALEEQIRDESAYIIVESSGMLKYKSLYPNATSIFIYTEYESTKKQLLERGGDVIDINNRLMHYKEEIEVVDLYDVVIENPYGKFVETVERIKEISMKKKNA